VIRVAGLDLSLTSAGIARLHMDDPFTVKGSHTGHVGEIGKVGATLHQRAMRIARQTEAVIDLIGATLPDLAVVEAPSMGSVGGQPHDRSGLWWGVVGYLISKGVAVAEVAPQTLKVYACGTAGSSQKPIKKHHVIAASRIHWGRYFDITNDDIADGTVLVAMGARWLGHPIDTLPTAHTRALASVRWPTLRERS
jgi:crossover junction endodeoxyribonuclease RuvC